jgi:DNA-binding NarL/FixJ family response regulator
MDGDRLRVTLIRILHGVTIPLSYAGAIILRASNLFEGYAEPSLELIMLSGRQREVMLLVAEGLSNKEIARRLQISDGTVKVHLQHIYSKLGIRNRTMLATLATSSGI